MEIENNLILKNENNINLEKRQNDFFQSSIGKAINTGIDIGLRTILPDFIENQVIEVKENLMNYGLKEGISKTIKDTIETGKSIVGIVTGNFDNINQMENAVKKGGLIDTLSTIIDKIVDSANKKGAINNNVSNAIKNGKSIILNNIENNIEKNFSKQIEGIENLNKYINNWKVGYENKNFEVMEKNFNKIEKELSNLVPLENSLSQARKIENIHNLIKNNGHNFSLTDTELELLNDI